MMQSQQISNCNVPPQIFYQTNGNQINQNDVSNNNAALLLTNMATNNGLLTGNNSNYSFTYEYPSYPSSTINNTSFNNCNNNCTPSTSTNTPKSINTSNNYTYNNEFDHNENNQQYNSINIDTKLISNAFAASSGTPHSLPPFYSQSQSRSNGLSVPQPPSASYAQAPKVPIPPQIPQNTIYSSSGNNHLPNFSNMMGNNYPNNHNFGQRLSSGFNKWNNMHPLRQNKSSPISTSTASTIPTVPSMNMPLFPPQMNSFSSSISKAITSTQTPDKPFLLPTNTKTPSFDDLKTHSPLSAGSASTIDANANTLHPLIVDNNPKIRYDCQDCKKAFKHKSNLKIHRIIHTKSALKCEFCDKKFARKGNLKQHLRVHTDERPYSCSFCPKKFKQPHSLKDHIRIHTGEKPFLCEYCGKSFNVKHNMVIHRRLHTGERPFNCTICAKKFASKSSLNGHTKKFHPQYWTMHHSK